MGVCLIKTFTSPRLCLYVPVHVHSDTICICQSCIGRTILSVRSSVSPSVPGLTADICSYNILFASLSLGGVHMSCIWVVSYSLSSIHPSLQPAINPPLEQYIFVSRSIIWGQPSCTLTLDVTVPSFWAGVQTTNSPSALVILRAFQSHMRPLWVETGFPKNICLSFAANLPNKAITTCCL